MALVKYQPPPAGHTATPSQGPMYNNGFGDFCFARFLPQIHYHDYTNLTPTRLLDVITFKELNGLQRYVIR